MLHQKAGNRFGRCYHLLGACPIPVHLKLLMIQQFFKILKYNVLSEANSAKNNFETVESERAI